MSKRLVIVFFNIKKNFINILLKIQNYTCIGNLNKFHMQDSPRNSDSRPWTARVSHMRGPSAEDRFRTRSCKCPTCSRLPSRRGLQVDMT